MKEKIIEMYNLKVLSDKKIVELIKKKIVSEDVSKEDIRSILDDIGIDIDENKLKAQAYLDSTDWIVAKIGEKQVLGEDVSTLLEKYSEQISERTKCREIL